MSIQHSAIADADRHEPKGASTASNRQVLTAKGDGTTEFANTSYNDLTDVPAAALPLAGGILTGPFKPAVFTMATLPSTVTYKYYLIVVTDATGGPALCLSNGTSWINVNTNAAVA